MKQDLEVTMKELELCQMHVDTSSQRTWQSGALLLAGALAALGFALQVTANDAASAAITTVMASGAIYIVFVWQGLIKREKRLQHASVERMRYLESQLRMMRQRLLKQADDQKRPRFLPDNTTNSLLLIGIVLQIGWATVALWRWLIYAGAFD